MNKFISIGHGNTVAASRIVAVVTPESSPVKRLIQDAKEDGRAIDTTAGRKTRAVLIADTGHVILCALQPETVTARLNGKPETETEAGAGTDAEAFPDGDCTGKDMTESHEGADAADDT